MEKNEFNIPILCRGYNNHLLPVSVIHCWCTDDETAADAGDDGQDVELSLFMNETSGANENQGTSSLDAVDSGSFDNEAVKERPAEGDQHEASVDL